MNIIKIMAAATVMLGAVGVQAALPAPSVRYDFAVSDSDFVGRIGFTLPGFIGKFEYAGFETYDFCVVDVPVDSGCIAASFFDGGGNSDRVTFEFVTPALTFETRDFDFAAGALGQFGTFQAQGSSATLAVSDPTAVVGGVPEPTSWAMLIIGFGLTGAAVRQRRASTMAAA